MNQTMKPINDEDLTLLYYGEHEDPQLAARVADSAELTARFEALSRELAAADTLVPPQRGEEFGQDMWHRIAPELEGDTDSKTESPRWWQALVRPRFSFAGAAAVAVVAIAAFLLGRGGIQQGPAPTPVPADDNFTTQLASLDSQRLLTRSVAGHLGQLDRVLTSFVNQDSSSQRETNDALDLLVQNRIYRRAARSRGDLKLATFLEELEPTLIEIAHHGQHAAPATRQRMQQQLRDGVLFRVRILNNEMNRTTASL